MRAQSCLILFDPRDYSPPASSIHGISQVRTLEWLPFPSPGHLHHPGTEPRSPALQVNSLPSEPPEDGDTKVKKKKNSCPHISQANGVNYILTAERVHVTSHVTLFSLLNGFPFMLVTLLFNTGLCKWLHFASSINGISPGAKWNMPDPCSFDATLMVEALH